VLWVSRHVTSRRHTDLVFGCGRASLRRLGGRSRRGTCTNRRRPTSSPRPPTASSIAFLASKTKNVSVGGQPRCKRWEVRVAFLRTKARTREAEQARSKLNAKTAPHLPWIRSHRTGVAGWATCRSVTAAGAAAQAAREHRDQVKHAHHVRAHHVRAQCERDQKRKRKNGKTETVHRKHEALCWTHHCCAWKAGAPSSYPGQSDRYLNSVTVVRRKE
jgi:hypothetical protein